MSLLAATQIPKPSDEQAFERASIILWRGILSDPNVQRNGRRGQRQNGVDIFGIRDGDSDHHVGIQCKLKSDGHSLNEKEVRAEVALAVTFKPRLKEYFIITTAPDDVAMQELARTLMGELKRAGKPMLVYVWGWNTLEEKITEDSEARNAFDPSYNAHSAEILAETKKIGLGQEELGTKVDARLQQLETLLKEHVGAPPGDTTTGPNLVEAHLDAEIDNYRQLSDDGKPETAKGLFESLFDRVKDTASGRILFRIKANIGSCQYALGHDEDAAALLLEAYEFAPDEPKAIANKAFALLIKGFWRELQDFGGKALHDDPANEVLAGYLIQSARFDDSAENPLDLIPLGLRETSAVSIGLVDFYRWRRPEGEWWPLARKARAVYPDDPHARQFAAEADIDEVLTSEFFQLDRKLESAERGQLRSAVMTLRELWDRVRLSEGAIRPEDAAICGNIIVALHALGDFGAGLEVARQGLSRAPEDQPLLERAAMVAIDGHDIPFAKELLPKLKMGSEATVIAFRIHSSTGDWPELAKMLPQAEFLPDSERLLLTTAAQLAAVLTDPLADRRQRFAEIAAAASSDARASIVVADIALEKGVKDVADEAFKSAKALVGPSSHMADRLMVSRHAAWRDEWSLVVDMLLGHVAEDEDSENLRSLARGLANDTPIRVRASKFFERLPDQIRELPFYLSCEGFMRFNQGDLAAAEVSLRRAIKLEPALNQILALVSVFRRTNRNLEIKVLLDGLDLVTVKGSALQKMHLAQVLRDVGEPRRAIAFGYNTFLEAKNDPQVALTYFGLVMMHPGSGDDLIPAADTVALDTFVRLEGDAGAEHRFLIVPEGDRPFDDEITPDHPMAAASIGLGVGDTFTIPAAFGGSRQWRVAEIKHKYLHALHDVTENFEKRFPNAQGFYSVRVQEGDIQPALDQIRKASEANRNLADIYLVNRTPLAMVAQQFGRDTIGLADYIRSLDKNIQTCEGGHAEREGALRLISSRRASGAVLDTYAAWTIATLDAFEEVKAVFGKIVVPRSVLDDLRALADHDVTDGRATMTIAWRDGQFFRQERSAEEAASIRQYVLKQIDKVEAACSVLPATAPDALSEFAVQIGDIFGSHVLDPAFMALENYVLVSEDLYYRQWTREAVGVSSVWLQPVLMYGLNEDLLSLDRYAQLLVGLAWRRHGHLTLNASVLFDVVRRDDSDDLVDLSAVTRFVGGEKADMKSHVGVVRAFLKHAWADATLSSEKLRKATHIVVTALMRHSKTNWGTILALLYRSQSQRVQDCLRQWISTQSLPMASFRQAQDRIAKVEGKLAPAKPRFGLPLPNYGPSGTRHRPGGQRKKRR